MSKGLLDPKVDFVFKNIDVYKRQELMDVSLVA